MTLITLHTVPQLARVVCQSGNPQNAPGALGYTAIFVRAGRTRSSSERPSDLEIPAGALRRAAAEGLFDRRAVFLDHAQPGAHPSLRDLAGVTAGSRWDEAAQAVLGELHLFDNETGRTAAGLLAQAVPGGPEGAESALQPDIGLSIVFFAQLSAPAADGVRTVHLVESVQSVDLVFQPAAGGRVLESLPAARQPSGRPTPWPQAGRFSTLEEEKPMKPTQNQPTTPEGEPIQAAPAETPGAGDGELQARLAMAAGPQETPERRQEPPAAFAVGAILRESGLPEASRLRLADADYGSLGAVRAAVEAEREYLARLAADDVVKLGGQAPRGAAIQGGRTGKDQLQAALDALLSGVRPPDGVAPLSGIREAYLHLSGDYEMTGVFHAERVALAAVDSSSMAGMVANALNKAVINAFQMYPRWWEPITMIEDFANLQQVKWITLGGVGELPTVAEGSAYTELTWDDQTETASFIKKGGYLGLTIEAIDKDDTRRLQSAPRALAQAAWLTLSKSISAIFTANSGVGPTMSDAVALFHANHGNLGSTALSITSYAAARTAMRKQAELNSSERLGALTAPKFLLVPPDLEITALQVLASESDYTYALSNGTAAPANAFAEGDTFRSRMEYARRRVIVVDLWTDTNNWAAAADPMLYPTIGLGYRYGRTPEVFSVASPTAGLMFSNDVMPVKVRFFYAVGPVDYRGLYKANVA